MDSGRRTRSNALLKLKALHNRATIDVQHTENVQQALKCFELSDEQLRQVVKKLEAAFEEGLDPKTAGTAAVKMLPSFVRAVPSGQERGDFLALDLGGTNFRVLLVRLDGRRAEMSSRIFRVPDHLQKGSGEAASRPPVPWVDRFLPLQLFDHIAACLARFLDDHHLKGTPRLPLGFTFSFPCRQEGLAHARLLHWTKGFSATGVEGRDVVQLLREACGRRGDLDLDVAAVLNDTTGTLMACAFQEPSCRCGVICGTGTNACYVERVERIAKLRGDEGAPADGEMVVNTEWGAFGDDGALDFVRTRFDRWLDELTINPGRQLFEKMISGMFLGELVRVVLERLASKGHLFNGDPSAVARPGLLPHEVRVGDRRGAAAGRGAPVLEDPTGARKTPVLLLRSLQILEEIGCEVVTPTDCYNVAFVCTAAINRAAHLCAAGVAALLRRMGRPYTTVGVDGSVFRFHPTFAYELESKIDDLLGDEGLDFQLLLSEDGSGKGAALVAAVASRGARPSKSRV
ncbi:hypothetical protein M3Y99_01490800 [Aphelenchoides fujianensis]|nr:hypothetical protein M3Y99_01490800 [Aphelenchoides fujianensis]